MAPTRIYVKPMLALLREQPVHAMAHITGGGLSENIIRVVPEGLGLEIDAGAWTLPPVFEWLQREGAVEDAEMWRTFNCGIGFTVLLPEAAVAAVQARLAADGLESWPIGRVVAAGDGERVRIG
jgi:phosphoribosylformylglycinamidine cyclo-ligase